MICGAVISDNNTDGIGWGCMANVVKPAIKETMWEVYGLDIWVAKANRIKEAFLNAYAGVKFRNEFKRGFYESMAKAERVSKKDYEVVEKWGKIKANAFRGVIIAKSYSYKKDIISALNSVPLKIN